MTTSTPAPTGPRRTGPVRQGVAHDPAEVLATRRVGAYQHLTLAAPRVAETAHAGQFVALGVGGETSGNLLRRSFSLHRATPVGQHGAHPGQPASPPGTIEIVVSAVGPGTRWLASRRVHDVVDVVGPLGRAFPVPTEPVPCVLVGGGYGSAPLFWLAEDLRARGCHVEVVLGAASEDRLFGVGLAERTADGVTVTTDDGSAGHRGWVSDVLPSIIERTGAAAVYACGPMGMLRAVSAIAAERGAVAQVAVEESMACGVGVCMTCVLPVTGNDGRTRMVRSCVEGPVFRGDRVRWDAFSDGYCHVPDDAVGAPGTGGH